jgi:GGDEF domain-containing protein
MMFAVHTLPLRNEHGTIIGGTIMTQDITARMRFEADLLHHAFHDRLTGLPNRALFLDRLYHTLERLRRGAAGACAVLFLDLNQFKVVNDSLGHPPATGS